MSDNTPGYPFPKRASIHQRRAQESVPPEPQVHREESQPSDSLEASRTSARSRVNDTDFDQIVCPGSHETLASETAVPTGLPTRRTRRVAHEELSLIHI